MLDALIKLQILGVKLPYALRSGRSDAHVVAVGGCRGTWLSEPLMRPDLRGCNGS